MSKDISKIYDPALLLPQWDGQVHKLPIRVYYEDTDAGGIVYHSVYVNYAERGRTEMLRAIGYDQSRLVEEENILFAVRSMNVDFRRPAVLDDLLSVETRIKDIKGASFVMDQRVMREEELLVGLEVKIASISTEKRPMRTPKHILDAMQGQS